MVTKTICSIALTGIAFLSTNPLLASAYLKPEGEGSVQWIYSEAVTRHIVGAGKIISPGGDKVYPIWTGSNTIVGTYGLSSDLELKAGATFKSVDGKKKNFSGLTETFIHFKRPLFTASACESSMSIGYSHPVKEYDTNSIDAPGTYSKKVPVSLSTACFDSSFSPLMVGLDLKYKYREGEVPNQTEWRLDLYYNLEKLSIGGFYGGVRSLSGDALGEQDDFRTLNERYNYAGASAYIRLHRASLGLSFVEKLKDGMINSDINSNASVVVGYDF